MSRRPDDKGESFGRASRDPRVLPDDGQSVLWATGGGDSRPHTHDRGFRPGKKVDGRGKRLSGNFMYFRVHFEREVTGKSEQSGATAATALENGPKRWPSFGVAALGFPWMSLDQRGATFCLVFWHFSAIFLGFWTSLDVLERYWMVGRVGIEPTTN